MLPRRAPVSDEVPIVSPAKRTRRITVQLPKLFFIGEKVGMAKVWLNMVNQFNRTGGLEDERKKKPADKEFQNQQDGFESPPEHHHEDSVTNYK